MEGRPHILVLVDKELINSANLQLAAYENGYRYLRFESPYSIVDFEDYEELEKYAAYFDMVIIAKNSIGQEEVSRNERALGQLRDYIQNNEKAWLLKTYPLPEGDSVMLYTLNS